ncbi:MAG: hypothetical protein ACE5J3_05655, partial [Methanosarcinales archaeon]
KPVDRSLKVPSLGVEDFKDTKLQSWIFANGFEVSLPKIVPKSRNLIVPKFRVETPIKTVAKDYLDTKVIFKEFYKDKTLDETAITISEPKESEDIAIVFEEFIEDDELWLVTGSTGLPASSKLFYIQGLEGMGFEVFKGLLRLELMDRGRKPKIEYISAKELNSSEKLKHISHDTYDYYKLIWIKDFSQSWSSFFKKGDGVKDTKIEVDKALEKEIFKYVVFANILSPEQVNKAVSIEEVNNQFLGVEEEFKNIFKVYQPIKLQYCFDRHKASKLGFDTLDVSKLQSIAEVFAKILQINKKDFKVKKNIVSDFHTLDDIWKMMYARKNSALETLRDKYTADPEIVQYLPPSAKGKESEEHFVIKQLSLKTILKKENWNITELDGRDYNTEWNKEIARGEDYPKEILVETRKYKMDSSGTKIPIKKPDIAFKEKNKKIWIEIETCKNLDYPLKAAKDKLIKIIEVSEEEKPDELWMVFPYRKYFIYGKQAFENRIRKFFNNYRKNHNTQNLKPRIFFADLYSEKFVELKELVIIWL